MKVGDTVDIFQDPLTKRQHEGQATLIHLQQDNAGVCEGNLVQRWLVQFTGDVRQYSRTLVSDVAEEGGGHAIPHQ